jgi:hypothetical protein
MSITYTHRFPFTPTSGDLTADFADATDIGTLVLQGPLVKPNPNRVEGTYVFNTGDADYPMVVNVSHHYNPSQGRTYCSVSVVSVYTVDDSVAETSEPEQLVTNVSWNFPGRVSADSSFVVDQLMIMLGLVVALFGTIAMPSASIVNALDRGLIGNLW